MNTSSRGGDGRVDRRAGIRLGWMVLAAAVVVLVLAAAGAASHGGLTQLAGTDGCVSETGSGGDCADGKALVGSGSLAVSSNGKNVYYVTGTNVGGAVAVFARDASTGALTQLAGTDGCVSETGSGGDCADGNALIAAGRAAISPDDKSVYVTAFLSDAVAVFVRDPATGALTQLAGTDGCVSETGSGGDCADGKALDGTTGVAVSHDGKHVYVASIESDAVAVFARDSETGVLTQLAGTDGCVSETGSGGACADGKALDGARFVGVTKNGKNVYVASGFSDAVAVFARDPVTGALTQLAGTDGCVSETGSGGDCADGKALDDARSVGISNNGRNVYVASPDPSAVAVFARDPATGALTQLPGTDGCVSETGSGGDCADGKALLGAGSVAVSHGGKNVYVQAATSSAVAVFSRH